MKEQGIQLEHFKHTQAHMLQRKALLSSELIMQLSSRMNIL